MGRGGDRTSLISPAALVEAADGGGGSSAAEEAAPPCSFDRSEMLLLLLLLAWRIRRPVAPLPPPNVAGLAAFVPGRDEAPR